MRQVLSLGVAALLLAGCMGKTVPPASQLSVSAPAGLALPAKARVMMVMAASDLDRPLVIQATLFRSEQTSVNDGRTVERAAHSILAQAFPNLATNQPSMRPQLVVKVTASPRFSKLDRMLKIGCGLDLYQADGTALGNFVARFDHPDPVEYKDALADAYGHCFKRAADQMLASPALARVAKAGYPDPHPAAFAAFMESLGLK